MKHDFQHTLPPSPASSAPIGSSVPLDRRQALWMLGSAVSFVAACGSEELGDGAAAMGGAGGDPAPASTGGAGTSATASAAWATGGTARLAASYPDPFENGPGSSCSLTCFTTLGPCYAQTLERKDISEGYPGLPMRLSLLLVDEACNVLPGVSVDIWHTSHSGHYSGDDTGLGFTLPPGLAGPDAGPDAAAGTAAAGLPADFCTGGDADAEAHRYFRGVQTTDARGRVDFDTCYPGWYTGRALHIHFIVRRNGQEYVTSQLYLPEELTREILGSHPDYASLGQPDTTNSTDTIFLGPDEVLEVQRQPDGVLLAYKTLVVRSSLDTALCGSDFPGGPRPSADG